MRLAVIRHGPTDWNADGRLQGRSDIPLSAAGREAVQRWRLPTLINDWPIAASPLERAQDTARMLAPGRRVETEPLLTEMSYGAWEGARLSDLRAEDPAGMAAAEGRGLDLEPPGGESPRAVQVRLQSLLTRWAQAGQDRVAVTHKGVIRAVFAMALEWNMLGKPPVKLLWEHAHLFHLSLEGGAPVLRPDAFNIALRGDAP